ncbi:MAG: hypothetical protein ACO3A4_12630 [Silvanigrellaceae bacterium]
MSIQQRAVVLTDEKRNHAIVRQLRESLGKIGLNQVLCTLSPVDISNVVYASQLPILFIDHDPKFQDGMRLFERIARMPGNQLLQCVLIVSNDEKGFTRSHKSLGFAGVVHKPVQHLEVADVVKPLLFKNDDINLKHAHGYALSFLKKDFKAAEDELLALKKEVRFKRKLDLARIHLSHAQGLGSQVMTIFDSLMKTEKVDLCMLSEYAFFLRKFSIYEQCLAVFAKIREQFPNWQGKVWEEILFLGELEKLDEIAVLAETQKGDDATVLLARLMYCMGLEQKVGELLASNSEANAAFQELMLKQEKQAQGNPAPTAEKAAAVVAP